VRPALVTGCGNRHGIGFASVRALAEHGAAVAVTSTTARIHERAAELAADGYMEQTASLVVAVRNRFGSIDILVNNAGLAQLGMPSPSGRFIELDPSNWHRALDHNLTMAFNVPRLVAQLMVGLTDGGRQARRRVCPRSTRRASAAVV
jgi:3-oxoacyl-[acyl-carrier protein] reductase